MTLLCLLIGIVNANFFNTKEFLIYGISKAELAKEPELTFERV